MPERPVTFAVLSPARWARLLMDSVADSPMLEFGGVWSRSERNCNETVAAYGGRAYESYEALLADEAIEAVVLPTPHFLHYPQTMAALEAGKHVFVEKPIANTVEEAAAMHAKSRECGLVLSVGLQLRRTGGARKAKAMIEGGELGELAVVRGALGATLVPQYSKDDWEQVPEKCPGGPLDNLAVHYIDVMQYLIGPVRRVCGFTSDRMSLSSVPSMATFALEFENGVLGTFTTHQVSAYVSEVSIYGDKGVLHFKRAGQELLFQEILDPVRAKHMTPSIETVAFEGPHPHSTALTAELEDFARCIRNGGQPEVGAPEGIISLKVIRAVMEAAASGRTVEID